MFLAINKHLRFRCNIKLFWMVHNFNIANQELGSMLFHPWSIHALISFLDRNISLDC